MSSSDGINRKFSLGTFFCSYFLESRSHDSFSELIAFGLLDILPNCVNSSYFVWNPNLKHLSLGVYSALIEIGMVREIAELDPGVSHYVIGYYVHNNEKMRYKLQYCPSEMFVQQIGRWMDTEQALEWIEEHAGHPIPNPPSEHDAMPCLTVEDLLNSLESIGTNRVIFQRTACTVSEVIDLVLEGEADSCCLTSYCKFLSMVGTDFAARCLYALH
jgi:hypothetical protein